MIRTTAILGLILCSGTAFAQPKPRKHGPEAKAAGLNVKVLQSLDVRMQRQSQGNVSGVVGIIGRHGKIGYFEAFGRRDIATKKPMTKDTLFRIFSMTKPITAVTAMTLWEEGKFKLDDPIAKHLPEWKGVMVKEGGKLVPAKTPITPRHLMTHSSGVATYSDLRKGLKLTPNMTLSQVSKTLAKWPLTFHPGSKFKYGYSLDILGRYIEAIEGKPLDQVMRERVFDKLGMNDTEFWVKKKSDRDRIATVYRRNNAGDLVVAMRLAPGKLLKKPAAMMGGGGLVSTAGDYAKFCQMLLSKGKSGSKRMLKQKTVELMFQNHLEKSAGRTYGLGGAVDANGGYAWGGAAGTRFYVDPKNDAYAVFMVQCWRYTPPTFKLFRGHVNRALLGAKKAKKVGVKKPKKAGKGK